MRSILMRLAVVVCGLSASVAGAADAPKVSDVIPAVMPSVAPAAVATNQVIIPVGCKSGNCGSNCMPCETKKMHEAAPCHPCTTKSSDCGGCDPCSSKGHCHGGRLTGRGGCGLGGCGACGAGFGACVTPILGTGAAGTHGICCYGSYNLR